MGKTIPIRVDESLAEILERVRKDVANDMKKSYKLDKISIQGTLASQILAAKLRGQKTLSFKIEKTSLNKGVLKLVY